jgi:hypothetical protein
LHVGISNDPAPRCSFLVTLLYVELADIIAVMAWSLITDLVPFSAGITVSTWRTFDMR